MEGDSFKDLLRTIFWIASVAPDEPQFNRLNLWLHKNADAFPRIWTSLLNNDEVLDNKALRALIMDITVSSETSKDNPLIKSPTINTFAVRCLDQLRQDVFSRKDRERIMKGWFMSTESSTAVATDGPIESASLDPAVLSLKAKVMQRAAVYDGMKYQDLANLADGLASTKMQSLGPSIVSFKELVRATMSHVTANLDQPRNREYALGALNHLRKKTKSKSDSKKIHKLNYALITLFDTVIEAFAVKETQLNDLDIISRSDYTSVKNSFKRCLLGLLEELLTKTRSSKAEKQAERSLTALSIIDALGKQEVNDSELTDVVDATKSFAAPPNEADIDVGKRLDTFLSMHSRSEELKMSGSEFGGDPLTVYGRKAIKETVQALVTGKDQHQKLDLLKSILEDEENGLLRLESVLAVRHIIMACEGLLLCFVS
jgi:nucleolar pre-ribosomal-associated protein 2